jgi:hypothetical protein
MQAFVFEKESIADKLKARAVFYISTPTGKYLMAISKEQRMPIEADMIERPESRFQRMDNEDIVLAWQNSAELRESLPGLGKIFGEDRVLDSKSYQEIRDDKTFHRVTVEDFYNGVAVLNRSYHTPGSSLIAFGSERGLCLDLYANIGDDESLPVAFIAEIDEKEYQDAQLAKRNGVFHTSLENDIELLRRHGIGLEEIPAIRELITKGT